MSGTFSRTRGRRAISLATRQSSRPTRRPSRGNGPLAAWQPWALEGAWGDQRLRHVPPADDQAALLMTAYLQAHPPEARLPAPPEVRSGDVNVTIAKCAVASVCRRINATAAPMIPPVQESRRGSWR
jgi:hypothetical protein